MSVAFARNRCRCARRIVQFIYEINVSVYRIRRNDEAWFHRVRCFESRRKWASNQSFRRRERGIGSPICTGAVARPKDQNRCAIRSPGPNPQRHFFASESRQLSRPWLCERRAGAIPSLQSSIAESHIVPALDCVAEGAIGTEAGLDMVWRGGLLEIGQVAIDAFGGEADEHRP